MDTLLMPNCACPIVNRRGRVGAATEQVGKGTTSAKTGGLYLPLCTSGNSRLRFPGISDYNHCKQSKVETLVALVV